MLFTAFQNAHAVVGRDTKKPRTTHCTGFFCVLENGLVARLARSLGLGFVHTQGATAKAGAVEGFHCA